jgi:hypothetical protein
MSPLPDSTTPAFVRPVSKKKQIRKSNSQSINISTIILPVSTPPFVRPVSKKKN